MISRKIDQKRAFELVVEQLEEALPEDPNAGFKDYCELDREFRLTFAAAGLKSAGKSSPPGSEAYP